MSAPDQLIGDEPWVFTLASPRGQAITGHATLPAVARTARLHAPGTLSARAYWFRPVGSDSPLGARGPPTAVRARRVFARLHVFWADAVRTGNDYHARLGGHANEGDRGTKLRR